MAKLDSFTNFFKKRKEQAEENIQKVRDFKRQFIAEPLQKIPQLAFKDLFKIKKDQKSREGQIKKSQQKIQDFERFT